MQCLIVEFIISFNFKPTIGIHIYDKIYQTVGYAPRVHKHMTLMAKVNHLAWFKEPIFQEAYLESTLPLEIPTAYSYRSLWSQLISCIYQFSKLNPEDW